MEARDSTCRRDTGNFGDAVEKEKMEFMVKSDAKATSVGRN